MLSINKWEKYDGGKKLMEKRVDSWVHEWKPDFSYYFIAIFLKSSQHSAIRYSKTI